MKNHWSSARSQERIQQSLIVKKSNPANQILQITKNEVNCVSMTVFGTSPLRNFGREKRIVL